MAETLIVLSHPEARSFNAEWARCTARLCEDNGRDVLWSDLYRMGFDPAERAENYPDAAGRKFDPLIVQDHAAKTGGLPEIVAGEIGKIRAADRIIFHFPLWWFGPPAMLKGWFDRVLVHGALHTSTYRFDRGLCSGKRALFCVTTGSSSAESSPSGKEGDIRMLLWPLAYALRYLGFSVLEPVTVHGVHGFHTGDDRKRMEERLALAFRDHEDIIARFEEQPLMPFNADDDFDKDGLLRATAPSHSAFIRHHSG